LLIGLTLPIKSKTDACAICNCRIGGDKNVNIKIAVNINEIIIIIFFAANFFISTPIKFN